MADQITLSSCPKVPADVLVSDLGEESVLLHLGSEQYFGLDEVGHRMWKAIAANKTLGDAYEELRQEYDVDPDVLRRDFLELVAKLVDQSLLEVKGE